METKLLFKLEHSRKNQEMRFTTYKYQGGRYYDLRIYYFDEGGQEYRPTKKGITLNKLQIRQFINKWNEVNEQSAKKERQLKGGA